MVVTVGAEKDGWILSLSPRRTTGKHNRTKLGSDSEEGGARFRYGQGSTLGACYPKDYMSLLTLFIIYSADVNNTVIWRGKKNNARLSLVLFVHRTFNFDKKTCFQMHLTFTLLSHC